MALRARVLGLAARAVEQCLNSDRQDPVWPCHCGQTARRAGRRAKTVVTALGPLRLERAYYHCSACASGFFPRDRLPGGLAVSGSAPHEWGGGGPQQLRRGQRPAARSCGSLPQPQAQGPNAPPKPWGWRSSGGCGPAAGGTLYLGGLPVRASEREGAGGNLPEHGKRNSVWSAETRTPDQPPAPGLGQCDHRDRRQPRHRPPVVPLCPARGPGSDPLASTHRRRGRLDLEPRRGVLSRCRDCRPLPCQATSVGGGPVHLRSRHRSGR